MKVKKNKKKIQEVNTKWNSTYYMLECLLKQKSVLALCVTENGRTQNLSSTQWTSLVNVLHLLQLFEEVTKKRVPLRPLFQK